MTPFYSIPWKHHFTEPTVACPACATHMQAEQAKPFEQQDSRLTCLVSFVLEEDL